MEMNASNVDAQKLTYQEFPKHFVYQRRLRKWNPRQSDKAIGRINHATPSTGELYYLMILLTKVRGPKSYQDIRSVDGKIYETFREACYALGLLDDDSEFVSAIKEGSRWATWIALRKLFVCMLLSCCLQRPGHVWQSCAVELSEDFLYVMESPFIFRFV